MRPIAAPSGGMPAARHLGRMTLVADPRFPGGTSSAVAAEIRALAGHVDLEVVTLETAMFKGREINRTLREALDAHGIEPRWNPPVIRADVAVIHNPSCLKFDAHLPPRISCRTVLVVTHENFLRPGDAEGFDVAHCLKLIDRAAVCRDRWLVPVSDANRTSVERWTRRAGSEWRVAPFDWFNICDMPLRAPVDAPRDRRGRHSRPGLEKFPPMKDLLAQFPPHAERCAILGADALLLDPETVPPHWEALRFGEIGVAQFLADIDFFVYFTHPRWRESFGRVIAEAIAAGKVVITDAETARTFGEAVVASDGDVDAVVARFVADPAAYRAFVRDAQALLARFSPEAFVRHVLSGIAGLEEGAHALL